MDLSMLPKVDKILLALEKEGLNQPLLAESAKEAVERLRESLTELHKGGQPLISDRGLLFAQALTLTRDIYRAKVRPSLKAVINATGVVLHTNLGRAPLAAEAVAAVGDIARGYCNLELALETGKRGSRYSHVVQLLKDITGAEDALVVNNNAAAVLLVLDTLAKRGEAIVSRGQLVEIGDSFRIPDIMKKSGVRLVEVGTTNRTRLSDYAEAIGDRTKMIMQVHPSNFRITGFHEAVKTTDLAALARDHGIPMMDDLGAGCIFPLAARHIGEEPLVADVVGSGADIVTCSGDKLLGGPQAGLILGRRRYIEKIKKNPLIRALRVDKFTIAALEATLHIYRRGEAEQLIPTVAMLTAPLPQLAERAELLAALLRRQDPKQQLFSVEVVRGNSETGGGSLPGVELPAYLLEVVSPHLKAQRLMAALRRGDPPLMAYIREDKLMLDPRTMSDADLATAAALIARYCAAARK
ncbi:MAG: L-seryl-tRNA(Sec) selenium transferase [Clostridia bacterium]|nr:L-seryl-tRNA(Sec) selenium transferase [Clostridia bacterium]